MIALRPGAFAAFLLAACLPACAARLERVAVDPARPGFMLADSGKPFVAWGFNYDHDEAGRLIEEYWDAEWDKVDADFREMQALGANVARIHLQLGRFMEAPDRAREPALERLEHLVALAEETGVRLLITGLACYLKDVVPAWYDALSEAERWEVQARFWEAVAERCAGSPAVFAYDLMNEPVSPAGRRDDWLGPPFAGKYHFVQMIALDQAGRPRPEIARRWIERLVRAVRKHDPRGLITVGLVDWSLDRPGLTSGFVPAKIAGALDFLCVHIYPEAEKVDEALATLKGFAEGSGGKPVVIEETFPLKCSPAEFRRFLAESRRLAAGWVGFYWGRTPEECRGSGQIADHMMLGWLEIFREERPEGLNAPPP